MANTIIQLRNSTVTGNVPSSLANGEISINSMDGKFFYSTPSGSIITHYPYTGPTGLNKEVQFNDNGTLGSSSNLTFSKTTGVFTAPIVASSDNGTGQNFKVGDDAWIGDINNADTLRISGQQNSANAYIVFGSSNNSQSLGRAGSGPLTYTGDFKATGLVSGNELSSTQSSGDEGGQVNLAIPATGTSLTGSVTIDVYQNKLRFFQGDSAKGAYIDLTAASAGVGSDLLAPSISTDGWARNQANSAFYHANASYVQANTPSYTANSAASYANSAFATANAAFIKANTAPPISNSFGIIYTSNNDTFANATAANSQVNFVGESGVVVYANSTTKTITVAGTPGAQGLTVDYGFVYESINYSIDYGTL